MKRGFTLIELLIVVAIVAILAGVVLIAVNPARQMAQTRNAERSAEANAILSAINQYQIDNKGALPSCISATQDRCITTAASGVGTCTNPGASGADPCLLAGILDPNYIAEIPTDPQFATPDSGYNVIKTTDDPATARITVSAGQAELGETISFTR